MKKIILIFITLITYIMASSAVKAPDFAFPKTVSTTAKADLEKALQQNNAHDALNALIRLYLAETRIDPASLPNTIKETERVAEKFSDDPLSGIYDSFLAYLYTCAYSSNQWRYDQRELPMIPLPADITEWSGKQYKQKIQDLCTKSYSGVNKDLLMACKITDYADIIRADKLTATYYPNLLDFAYTLATVVYDQIGLSDETKNIYALALSTSHEGTPEYFLWLSKQPGGKEAMDMLKTEWDKYNNQEYAGIILSRIADSSTGSIMPYYEVEIDSDEDEENNAEDNSGLKFKRWFCDQARSFNKRFPNNPLKNNLLSIIDDYTSQQVNVKVTNTCALSTPVKVTLDNQNANKFSLRIYALSDAEYNDYELSKISKIKLTRKPVKTYDFVSAGVAPFAEDTVIEVTFDSPGYYMVVPFINGENTDRSRAAVTRCLPVVPVLLNDKKGICTIITNAADGAPAQGTDVSLVSYRNKKEISAPQKTDAQGVTKFNKHLDNNSYSLIVSSGNRRYNFDDCRIWINEYEPDTTRRYRANVLTDRALYHPGEKLSVLAVVSSSKNEYSLLSRLMPNGDGECHFTRELAKNKKITIVLNNTNGEKVGESTGKTDEFGRVMCDFDLPTDGLTGEFYIIARLDKKDIGYSQVMVSDYVMPDFEIKNVIVTRNVPNTGDVIISGNATSYAGMPLANTHITLIVAESSWMRWWFIPTLREKIFSDEVDTDAAGNFSIVVPDSVLNRDCKFFSAAIDAVSPTGSTAQAHTSFSTGKQYSIVLSPIYKNVNALEPLKPDVKILSSDGSEMHFPLKWALKSGKQIIASGDYTGTIDLSKITPGIYDLCVSTVDESLADEQREKICIYNTNTDIVPGDKPLWSNLARIDFAPQDTVEILYGLQSESANVYFIIKNAEEKIIDIKVENIKKGYHKFIVPTDATNEHYKVEIFSIDRCVPCSFNVELNRKLNDTKLKITGESFRDNLVPTANETWKLKVTKADGSPVDAALVLDMYNKALDALQPHGLSLSFPTDYYNTRGSINFIYPRFSSYSYRISVPNRKNATIIAPAFNFYKFGYMFGYRDYSNRMLCYSASPMVMRKSANMLSNDADMEEECAVEDDVLYDVVVTGFGSIGAEKDKGNGSDIDETPTEEFDFRDSYVPLAVWAPCLTTDSDGSVTYTFTVPNANTTWKLYALAWSKDMEIGRLMKEFVASKPVMVQPNLPRFLRAGDKCTIVSSVMNKTDEHQTVKAVIEIFNPLTSAVISTKTYDVVLDPMSAQTVSMSLETPVDAAAIGYRVRVTNGEFTDGEQTVIRILTNEAALIETTPFYLNPGDKSFEMKLPKQKNARISLTFCENPVWTIVSALPGMRQNISDYANSAAAAIFSAAVARGLMTAHPELGKAIRLWEANPSDSALVSMLQKNEDLKIALLNSTPWVQAAQSDTERMANLALIFNDGEIDRAISRGIEILKKLQQNDGGWKWGEWCDESSVWVTGNVLSMMSELMEYGWLPNPDTLNPMIKKALSFYDRKVEDTDYLYSRIRPTFKNVPISSNGQKVINATIKEIKKDWKGISSPSFKALAAEVLYVNGDKALANELMKSISEFGIYTKNQGLTFPSVNALYSYAMILDAYALIKPESKEVDGLRQQLIVRKQATDWGSDIVTTEVVTSILSSGTKWTVDAQGAEVKAGNTCIPYQTPMETATGSIRADLSKYAGQTLTISTPGTGPAYGAVYAQFSQTMDEVKASACDDLDIEKVMFVRRGTEWEVADRLEVGDRVKVQLTIHSKRNLQYVTIKDERPATFAPVDQLPGWVWSEGVGFYRENRDAYTQLNVVYMRPGTYLLTYEMNMGLAGEYSSGVATIQSQYAPEISAHSSGSRISVK